MDWIFKGILAWIGRLCPTFYDLFHNLRKGARPRYSHLAQIPW